LVLALTRGDVNFESQTQLCNKIHAAGRKVSAGIFGCSLGVAMKATTPLRT
jgi:hypothetical protein